MREREREREREMKLLERIRERTQENASQFTNEIMGFTIEFVLIHACGLAQF